MTRLRIGVAGGSIGGLTAAVVLHELGHDVEVFERSTAALQARGAGIVVLPATERYFVDRGGLAGPTEGESDVALTLTYRRYVDHSGETIAADPTNNRFSSWNTIYRALLDVFPQERYHLSHEVSGCHQDSAGAQLRFADGAGYSGDLIVAADGISSTIRAILEPNSVPRYAGYVAWRGTVMEEELPSADRALFADSMVYQVLDHSHILVYPIPGRGGSTEPGRRALNFVWYRNAPPADFKDLMTDRHGELREATMPPGAVRDVHLERLREDAAALLAPQLRKVVLACAEPFIQAIFDLMMERFVHGRVCVIGDAACSLRPHVAAGTAKACADAWALRDHLATSPDDVAQALAGWEAQQMGLARAVAAKSRAMGETSQFESTMWPGDPNWRFGLFGPGQ